MSSVPKEVAFRRLPIRRVLEFETECADGMSDMEDDVAEEEEEEEEGAPVATGKPRAVLVSPGSPFPKVPTAERIIFKFVNAPAAVDVQITRAFQWKGYRNQGQISKTDARVASLPFLEMCPRKSNKKTCHCIELASTPDFQSDMRSYYCRIVEESSSQVGNAYLMSLMIPKPDFWKGKGFGFLFKIPAFIFDGRVRIFYVCGPQFRRLFGLSSKRFYKLMRTRKENLQSGEDEMFHWSQDGTAYYFNGARRNAFRSDYWIDYMVKHGGHSATENFN